MISFPKTGIAYHHMKIINNLTLGIIFSLAGSSHTLTDPSFAQDLCTVCIYVSRILIVILIWKFKNQMLILRE